ncbi:pentapeptide repeat-containing protein [Leptothoe sp. PORK10 BA2]|uniref:pentapeptide repeat-containing protein n=1 Tax=Leptothoe sp. PORK10 BA2 TaxID=3110254 RepID=UPI002B213319|nr:pentapeptide repeat-containing protein [Leptothoe sp. PORK10 BA2]MEA5462581.1 pentapeptide repeat-containing protein [Leptothoe sp. PORK10 BA2]
MFAAEICQTQAFSYIPLFIRLRSLRAIENTLTETLENCPDLEPVEFVGMEGWLKDKNTRFLIILDGFDELLLQGRATGGLQEFLQQVSDFQERSHHQCLVTGRPLALQGVAQRITQNKTLERAKLQPMNDPQQAQWLGKWQAIFKEQEVSQFRQFLKACPTEIGNHLAREPLLIYLLARLHREKQLTSEMFADAKQESQAKLRVYRESVNWVLEKQRQDENLRLSGLDDPNDLREVLQEAALCVVQSGNETAQLSMLKARFQDSGNPVATSLKTAQETTGQSEDKALNNLLTTFYLRPGEGDKRGSVEFAHKSFGEYLFAERLMAAFAQWTELDPRNRYRLDDRAVHGQIYDLLGFGGLSVEIVEYVFELLKESDIDRVRLFQRLHGFYERWCEGEFLDQAPNENLPQKKFLQLRDKTITIGLKQVDIFAGLNGLIMLFKLHAGAQSENYPKVSADEPKPAIWFHPCGEPHTEQFDQEKLLKIIHYADSLDMSTFTQIVGPHLSSANLESANLESANLDSANLDSANLDRANLDRANLDSAILSRAILSRAILSNAILSNAVLSNAILSNANLYSATLDSATLDRAYLYRAYLYKAYLYKADLSNATLSNATLDSANLDSANLSNATLDSATLDSVNLDSATLDSATLDSATLDSANLYRAYLYRAYLYRANLYSANLDSANLDRAYLDSANLDSANLDSANLDSANLDRANFDNAILLGTQLGTVQNLTIQQLEGKTPPLICNATLPPVLKSYQDRDRDRLPAVLKERYPGSFKSLEKAEKYINEQHPPTR